MAAKRRKIVPRQVPGISEEAITAWRAGDYWALHRALKLPIWMMPDWDSDPPEEAWKVQPLPHGRRYPDPAVLKEQLLDSAVPPPRRWHF